MSVASLFEYESDKLFAAVNLFRNLLPHNERQSSIHSGEEGRFVENLLVEFLRKTLPDGMAIASGFVVRVGRKKEITSSKQIDILIYDTRYAPLMKYGDAVVIHNLAVIAAISVKKNITLNEIKDETESLSFVGSLCGGNPNLKPYLAIFAFDIRGLTNFRDTVNSAWDRVRGAFAARDERWSANEMVNDLIVLHKFVIKSKIGRVEDNHPCAKFIFCGGNDTHHHMYVQHLISGISKSFNSRYNIQQSVVTEFPQTQCENLGTVDLCCINRPFEHR